MSFPLFALWFLLGLQDEPSTPRPAAIPIEARLAELALTSAEREEGLALALMLVVAGDCEAALERLDRLAGESAALEDEFLQRVRLERRRLVAWMDLRDAFLAELEASGKPLTLELDGKKVATPVRREGGELVLEKGPRKRLALRELAPEALLPAIPKERFEGPLEALKVYAYCVSGNAKWKRLTTQGDEAAALKRDAEEFYPRLRPLGRVAHRLEGLAARGLPVDDREARAALAELASLRADGAGLACLERRRPAASALAATWLAQVAESMALAEFVRGAVTELEGGRVRLDYAFASPAEFEDWLASDDYLAALRSELDPVTAESEETRFGVGERGLSGNGKFCYRHVLEFQTPTRVRYEVRWEPYRGQAGKVFAFALGLLSDDHERHARAQELGFLYVDEQNGIYSAVRPSGDATVQLGQTYALELAHDGANVTVTVDGTVRATTPAPHRKEGRVFLWGHSDLRLSIPKLSIEGRVQPASLAACRARWVQGELEKSGLSPR